MRVCTKCKKEKPDQEFTSSRRLRPVTKMCRPCIDYHRSYNHTKRSGIKDAFLIRQRLLEEDPTCQICGAESPVYKGLALDHCHTSGKVRGLLCDNCNQALGKFRDSKELLQKAINYLDKYRETLPT